MQILVLSPRVAPGLLTAAAWDALRGASEVRAAVDDAHVRAVVAAGVDVVVDPVAPSADADVLWIGPTGDRDWVTTVTGRVPAATVVVGAHGRTGSALLDVVDVLDRLRSECPWTGAQTHESLTPYLLEEAHETLEALDSGDSQHLREELGDLLMQVVLHARIAAETEGWDVDDVAAGIVAKLVRRSPHVFGGETAVTAAEVDAVWERSKATEKRRASPTEGIPATLPALAYADKLLGRLGDPEMPDDGIGPRLLALVKEARAQGVDAEAALRQTLRAIV